MTITDLLSHKVTSVLGALTISGMVVGGLDSRHAGAGEVQELANMIKADRIERRDGRIESVEERIDDSELRIKRIEIIPASSRSGYENQELVDAHNTKERYLRKLRRLELGVIR